MGRVLRVVEVDPVEESPGNPVMLDGFELEGGVFVRAYGRKGKFYLRVRPRGVKDKQFWRVEFVDLEAANGRCELVEGACRSCGAVVEVPADLGCDLDDVECAACRGARIKHEKLVRALVGEQGFRRKMRMICVTEGF